MTVAYRVGHFREVHPNWSIITTIIDRTEKDVVLRAEIADETGRILATGHAEESRTSSQINRTSALENAETSAIGRCLAALGMGGTEFASADEVANAIHQQSQPAKQNATTTAPEKPAKVIAPIASQDALWDMCMEAAQGNAENAEVILKAASFFTTAQGKEIFISPANLGAQSEKYIGSTSKRLAEMIGKGEIQTLFDGIPF
jgi:hypothetical protein